MKVIEVTTLEEALKVSDADAVVYNYGGKSRIIPALGMTHKIIKAVRGKRGNVGSTGIPAVNCDLSPAKVIEILERLD